LKKIEIITTTPSLEGWKINKYCGVVTYQLVVGANLFRDVFSSFRDFFGGSARGYQKELENMERVTLDSLKKSAFKQGANAIIDLRLDYDEVSGGNKSMFMLTATGTAVQAERMVFKDESTTLEFVTGDRLNYEMEKSNLIKQISTAGYNVMSDSFIQKLIYYRIDALSEVMKYYGSLTPDEFNTDLVAEYLSVLPDSVVNNFISNRYEISKLIGINHFVISLKKINWFEFEVIKKMMKSSDHLLRSRALYLLTLDKEFYTISNLDDIKEVIQLLNKSYQDFPAKTTKKTLMGNDKEVSYCLNCGKTFSSNWLTCGTENCESNIYGIVKNETNPDTLRIKLKRQHEWLMKLLAVSSS